MLARLSRLSPPIVFAVLTLAAYGLLLPWTGFYWDDWPFAWIARFLGPAEFIPAFAPFRPFLGPIFFVTTRLVPPVPIYWQAFALVVRFLLGLAAWWTLRQVWPERPRAALITALLMLVFPGYSQHWVAFTHINQELIPFVFYILSFGFTFKALRAARPFPYVALAVLLQCFGVFPTEYFFGLEGMRFLLLLFAFQGGLLSRIAKALKTWTPYLLVWILDAAWLYYYYSFGPYHSYGLAAAESPNLLLLAGQALDALWKAGFYVWGQVLVLTFSSLSAPASLLTLGLAALSSAFLTPWLLRSAPAGESRDGAFSVSLILVGALGILLGRLPSLLAGLPLTLQSSYDRFMVSMMMAASLFIVGWIELLIENPRLRLAVCAVLVSLGVGQQFFNANIFRRDWERQGEIYWQMAWRMPALEPNTLLLTNQMPIDYETDASFTAPINWMYAPDYARGDLPYLLLYTEKRLGGPTLPSLAPGVQIVFPYRTVTFRGSTSKAVVIYMPPGGCLRVLDASRGDAELYAKLPAHFTAAIPLSDPSRILSAPPAPAAPPFFSEPPHGWCYYYAKAELALQQGDYKQVVRLGEEARSLGLAPQDATEWLIFIEAHARTGDLQTARQISQSALDADARLRRGVCALWRRILEQSPDERRPEIRDTLEALACAF